MTLPFSAFNALIKAREQGRIEPLALFLSDYISTQLLKFAQHPESVECVRVSPTGEIEFVDSLSLEYITRTISSKLEETPEFLEAVSLRVVKYFTEAGWVGIERQLTFVNNPFGHRHLKILFSFKQSG